MANYTLERVKLSRYGYWRIRKNGFVIETRRTRETARRTLAKLKQKEKDMQKALSIEDIAHVCHAANRAYRQCLGELPGPEWNALDEAHRQRIINGVEKCVSSPKGMITPRENHDNWLKTMKAMGWTYGEKENSVAKTHPCMKEYDFLPFEQAMKDMLFTQVIWALLPIWKDGTMKQVDRML